MKDPSARGALIIMWSMVILMIAMGCSSSLHYIY